MKNTLTTAELKRHGIAAIEKSLRYGPIHILKRNKLAAIVLSEEEYERLIEAQPQTYPGLTALQWLLTQPSAKTRDKAEIDTFLAEERTW